MDYNETNLNEMTTYYEYHEFRRLKLIQGFQRKYHQVFQVQLQTKIVNEELQTGLYFFGCCVLYKVKCSAECMCASTFPTAR